MLGRTHIPAAILAGLMLEPAGLSAESRFAYFIIIALGALLPDIDHPNSTIGRAFPATSWITNKVFAHRGIVHAIYLPAILWWLAVRYVSVVIGLAILIGIGSHLLCDILTKEGVKPLYPFSNLRARGFIRTGGWIERIILFGIIVGIAWKIF